MHDGVHKDLDNREERVVWRINTEVASDADAFDARDSAAEKNNKLLLAA